MRGSSVPATLALLVLATPRVAAAGPTKQQCVDANERAQALRQHESLSLAREQLAVCLSASCPEPVRQDCADRIAEIDRAMPTLVLEVKDGSGRDVAGLGLRVDGKLLVSHLDGAAVAIDPGLHHLELVLGETVMHTQTLVVLEGEKDRRERVVLGAPTGIAGSPQRTAAIAVAASGTLALVVGTILGLMAKATYNSALAADCKGNATTCNADGVSRVNTAHGQALASTASFITGGGLLAGGVVLWATAHGELRVNASPASGGLRLGGTF